MRGSDEADVLSNPCITSTCTRREPSTKRVVVIGAGPSGLLTAIYLARRGYNVEVHEKQSASAVQASPRERQFNYPIILSSRWKFETCNHHRRESAGLDTPQGPFGVQGVAARHFFQRASGS